MPQELEQPLEQPLPDERRVTYTDVPDADADSPRAPLLPQDPAPGSIQATPGLRRRYATHANPNFESLDFADAENEMLVEARGGNDSEILEPAAWKMWLIVIIIGMLTAIVAYGIDEGIRGLNWLKFRAVTHFMDSSEKAAGNRYVMPFAVPAIIFILINAAYVSVAAALVSFVEPVARGSGIGEIKCYLNGVRIHRVVRLKTLCCKAFGILFSVASGLPCGKEGPMIHSGAAIASGIATGKSSKLHWDTGLFRAFRSDSAKRSFVTAGAAAGVAAAFGAPIGGLLFAVEEVGSFWSLSLTVLVFVCSAVTPWTLAFLKHPTQYQDARLEGLVDFGQVEGSYNYADLPFLVLLGIIGGGLGALFIKANIALTLLRRRYVTSNIARFAEALVVSGLVSIVLILLVLRGYECVPGADLTAALKEKAVDLGCQPGYYNDMATYFFHGMESSVSALAHAKNNIAYGTLLKQLVPYYALTIITYGVYVPSGLFLPCLALGANLGHLYAQLWNEVLPASHALHLAHFAVFGGTAMLAGVVRMTISVIVIIMEATGNTAFFYPLVIICVTAKFFGDLFTHGVYEAHLHLSKVPLLENDVQDRRLVTLTAADVMNPSIVTIPTKLTVRTLVRALKRHPRHNAMLCLSEEGHLEGLLLRRSALILVGKRAWDTPLELADFVKSDKEREMLKLKKYDFFNAHVEREDNDKTLDLARYMENWPMVMAASTPVPRVHRVFRDLGLRHIVIVDGTHRPVGIIGRRQLCFMEPEGQDDQGRLDEENNSSGSPFVSAAFVSASPHISMARQETATPQNSSFLATRTMELEEAEDDGAEWSDAYRPKIN